jgi:putative FmdB family regulatory protein
VTYDYQCQRCGVELTVEQKITEPPLTRCKVEGCGGALRRLINSAGGFQLRGKGWFKSGGY